MEAHSFRPALHLSKTFNATGSSGISCGLAFRTAKDTPHDYSELSKHVRKTPLVLGMSPVLTAYAASPALDDDQPLLNLLVDLCRVAGSLPSWDLRRPKFQNLAEMPQLFLQEGAELCLNLESDKRTWTGTPDISLICSAGFHCSGNTRNFWKWVTIL